MSYKINPQVFALTVQAKIDSISDCLQRCQDSLEGIEGNADLVAYCQAQVSHLADVADALKRLVDRWASDPLSFEP